MRSFGAILFASLVLAGCAATGPTFTEHLATSNPIPASSGRLIFFRTRDSAQYQGAAASIRIDTGPASTCDYAGFKVVDVEPGRHLVTVRVDRWNMPGTCDLDVEVTAGNEHYLEIKPRPEHLAAGLAGILLGFGLTRGLGSGPFGLPTTGDIAVGVLVQGEAGAVGAAVESSGKQCGGGFSVESIARDLALPRVTNLRMTK